MQVYFSPTTKGFYDPALHGALLLNTGSAEAPVWEANPATLIPADAVAISRAEHQALLQAQTEGLVLAADAEGRPVAVEPPPLSATEVLLGQIRALELSVTPRRLREAVLGADNGWLAGVEAQIAALRGQLS